MANRHGRECLLLSLLLLPTLLCAAAPQWSEAIDATLSRLHLKQAPPATQEAAARGLLRRLLPSHLSSFDLRIIPNASCGGYSCYFINNANKSNGNGPEIIVGGTSAVEVASGLHWYLKYWCGAHISWDHTGGIQIASIPLAGKLPLLKDGGVMVQRPVPLNYYQNVVTSSYSFVWWDWKRWEKEIDWMALQGVNLPLAFTGQEAIWQKVFKAYNVSNEDLGTFFGGPAFLAWARMGNLHGWGGPLPQNWLDRQLAIQKNILSRMRELGMIPVLPSFSGNVPSVFQNLFPSANITRLGNWNTINGDPRWCCTFLLDPSDPLFVEVGKDFINQQLKEYGDITDIYNCDTFNENEPPTDDPTYISSLGAAVYKGMSKANENAIWLMQGWLFASDSDFWKPPQMKALVHSVPFGKMIVLDLFADIKPVWSRSSQFYGVPYIWCMLHNFGANVEMYGLLDAISSGPIDARLSDNSTMVGVGMCMEGIEQNPVVYELMSEMAFRSEKVHVEDWLRSYSHRRYGRSLAQIEAAWKILYHTIYNCTDGIADHNKDFLVQFPDLDPSAISTDVFQNSFLAEGNPQLSLREIRSGIPKPHLWYPTKEVIDALMLLIDVGSDLNGSLTFRYDLVDLTRQILGKLSNQVFLDAITAYQNQDVKALFFHSQKFTELIEDIDYLLASDDNFLLGTWLEKSKELAMNLIEKRQYEWNARTQITMWYDNTSTNQSKLHDYANKYWSGLLRSYYLPRASSYFSYMLKSLQNNESFALEEWRKEWISYSNKWQAGHELYPVKAEGDALAIAKEMVKKYLS